MNVYDFHAEFNIIALWNTTSKRTCEVFTTTWPFFVYLFLSYSDRFYLLILSVGF